MKFIKVIDMIGKEVLINLSNISCFYSKSETETLICLLNNKDYITVKIPIKVFEQNLDAVDDSRNVWVF
jgi:hypothetical protein